VQGAGALTEALSTALRHGGPTLIEVIAASFEK
jgi:hypothetical protein